MMKDVARRVLLNPGPGTTTDRVKQALVIPDVCPREEEFCAVMRDVRERLAGLVGDPAEVATIPIVGSGTTALEAALVSFVPQAGGMVILDNGDYGTRMVEMAHTHGIRHAVVSPGWGRLPDLGELEATLLESAGWATHLFFVHHETSSGLLNPIDEITALGRRHGLAIYVDAMSSYASLPLHVGATGVDVLATSSNKCVQGMAGLGLVIARRSAIEQARRVEPRGVVFNLVAEYDHLEKTGQSRFTVPPQVFSALREALRELEDEGGVEVRRARHVESMRMLVAGLTELGFELLLDPGVQSEILVAIKEPDEPWYDFVAMHDALLEQGFTIYPGKPAAQPTFRLAVLGAIDADDISDFLNALGAYLEQARRA
jgi:2-aminoethylphosphonate-pyruvate transaminase